MKNPTLKILLLILLPYFVYAADTNSTKNSYYILMKEKLSQEIAEEEKIDSILSNLITDNHQKIIFGGCDFRQLEGSKEDINHELSQNNFFEDYRDQLKKYHLAPINFSKVYVNDRSNSSDICSQNDYMNIIQLDNNELMITYNHQLVFYRRLPEQEEQNINNYYSNKDCQALEQVDMDYDYTDICYYNNMTILDVYNAMSYNPEKIFRKKIKVGKNFSVAYQDKDVDIDYKWLGRNKLEITQYFPGGVTYYIFIYQDNRTKLITTISPD